ncbi:hypothetical protein WJX73_003131 [Symbiochloris irregularis]|uniref:Hemolysin III n=1 Tax=Symbiochloris irregularis TaxID=706552 RepID=A0AAW1PLL0_9CHLO
MQRSHADTKALHKGSPTALKFRPAGSPAGTWQHTPWWHCVLLDPYERINVWSHAAPGILFVILGFASYAGYTPGHNWVHNPFGIFCFCAATTHLLSASTHVYPDNHFLEKFDHLGIVALVLGTPITALMAHTRGGIPLDLKISAGVMLAAAFLPPTLRVLGFTVGIVVMVVLHFHIVVNANLATQLGMYGLGACVFLRNGGHARFVGCTDHHLLHYLVTGACCLHVSYLLKAMQKTSAHLE